MTDKRILIIYTGGTFGMVPLKPGKTLAPGDLTTILSQSLPDLTALAHIDSAVIFNLDSSNMHTAHWKELGRLIMDNYHSYDGFVVVHGTDAMVYSATALSFMFSNLTKPIIFTGSQRPIAEIRSDARSNLIGAVELACKNIPEVTIYFANKLLRANRTVKVSSTRFDAFTSPHFPPLAEVGLDITFNLRWEVSHGLPDFVPLFNEHVAMITLYPGMLPEIYSCLLDQDIRGLIIQAYGSGNVPIMENSIIPLIEKASSQHIITVITSQVLHGRVNLPLYECGLKALAAGAVSASDMTPIAALVKLMFLLGKYDDFTQIRTLFQRNLAGELTPDIVTGN